MFSNCSWSFTVICITYVQYRLIVCVVMTGREAVKPEAVAHRTALKHTASTMNRQKRMSCDASTDAYLVGFQRSLPRYSSRRYPSAADEDLYCPMNGVQIDSQRHPPTASKSRAVEKTSSNLQRVCSDETLSLHSHSRRLQQAHYETPTRVDLHMSTLDVPTRSAVHRPRTTRDGHRRTIVPQSVTKSSSRKSRRIVASDRPDLLCTRKDDEGRDKSHGPWDYFSALGHDAAERNGQQHSSPPDELQWQDASPNETLGGTFLAVTQSPQSVVSDGSPASQYPTAPAASPVTVNSMVFNPPPRALVSSTPTSVCPTMASMPSNAFMMDRRSNPDSGYGSKIYCCRGTGSAVDPVPSGEERHLVSSFETDANLHLQSQVCSSFPDVVVDRPLCHSGQVLAAATLPRTDFDLNLPSGHQCCQDEAGSWSPNLDLRTYSETNLVVSPRRVDRGRSRVPIELADENSVVDIGEVVSPTSPLSLDSVDFITDKVADCMLSSPTNNVSNTVLPLRAKSYRVMPQKTNYVSSARRGAADEQLYCNVNSLSEAFNERLGSGNLSIITEDVGQTNRDGASYQKADNICRSPVTAGGLCDYVSYPVDYAQETEKVLRCQMAFDALSRGRPIGRSTTV